MPSCHKADIYGKKAGFSNGDTCTNCNRVASSHATASPGINRKQCYPPSPQLSINLWLAESAKASHPHDDVTQPGTAQHLSPDTDRCTAIALTLATAAVHTRPHAPLTRCVMQARSHNTMLSGLNTTDVHFTRWAIAPGAAIKTSHPESSRDQKSPHRRSALAFRSTGHIPRRKTGSSCPTNQ